MEFDKNMKSGYQGKPDAMRDKATKLMNHPGQAPDVIYGAPYQNEEKQPIRPFKCGGKVEKFAAGGVGKIRHDQATASGMPKNPKKKPV